MKLRRYQLGEEAAIWEVVFRATRVSNARDYHPELIERWAPIDKDMAEWAERLTETNPLVAIIDKKIVGMAEIETSTGYIDYFYVHPDFQDRGIGSALLGAIESETHRNDVEQLTADVSVTAKSFFKSRGFSVVESRSNIVIGHPAPQFSMAKSLAGEDREPASCDT